MSGTNAQKTPLGLSLNRHARAKALDQIWKRGLSLPCQVVSVRGSIVQVSFQIQQNAGSVVATLPNVTMPVATFEYVRPPIQVGCMGAAVAFDAYLGGMSGIGGGVANLGQPGNLGALLFLPISNVGWFSVNGNVLTLYGEPGVQLQTKDGTISIAVAQTGITITAPGNVMVVSPKVVITTLPTAPGITGQLWNDAGYVRVS